MIDTEALLAAWLQQEFPDARVVTETPNKLVEALPVIRVNGAGGNDNRGRLDRPRLSVESFVSNATGNGRRDARQLGEQIRDSIEQRLPGQVVAGGWVTRTGCNAKPDVYPYENSDVRMASATYDLWVTALD